MFIINHYLHFVLALRGASIIYRSQKYLVSTLKIFPEAFGVSSAGPTPVRLHNLQLIFKYFELFFTLVVVKLEDMVQVWRGCLQDAASLWAQLIY